MLMKRAVEDNRGPFGLLSDASIRSAPPGPRRGPVSIWNARHTGTGMGPPTLFMFGLPLFCFYFIFSFN